MTGLGDHKQKAPLDDCELRAQQNISSRRYQSRSAGFYSDSSIVAILGEIKPNHRYQTKYHKSVASKIWTEAIVLSSE